MLLIGLVLSVLMLRRERDRVLSEPLSSWQMDPSADCGVVLTGGVGRVKEGFSLLSRKLIKKLIISGVNPSAQLREIFPLWPLAGQLSEKDVILERRSATTFGNAQQVLPIIEALNCRDIVLVTSQVHMYRASRVFQATLPSQTAIVKHAVFAGRLQADENFEVWIEVLKSLFYSLWAY